MKIMWLSVAPWVSTGYGQQTAQVTSRLKAAGHDVAISATYGSVGITLEWEGMNVYPADHSQLNKMMLKHHIKREFGTANDVQVISLFDIWPWIDASPEYGSVVADFAGLDIASWLPVDSLPPTPKTLVALDKYDVRPIAMSRFGEEQLRNHGYDPLYVPHAIDTSVFKPADDRMLCRRELGIPEDKFVVGMVANNQGISPPRKSFPQVLQAFSFFVKDHPDAFLYLHTEVLGMHQGLNLLAIAEMFGVPGDAIGFVPQKNYAANEISPARMAQIYSALDVLANPSMGEGFGIPIVEAQACGTPVIVSPWTSMPELLGAGWTVGGQPWYNPASGAHWWVPAVDELATAFEVAYEARVDQVYRDQAREFALAYDADVVFDEFWVPALETLSGPREVPPLKAIGPNRAQRRAGKVAA